MTDGSERKTGQVLPFPQRTDPHGEGAWEHWVSGSDLADHLGVGERTIERWRAEGMPSQKFGRSRRYQPSRCIEWLEGGREALPRHRRG